MDFKLSRTERALSDLAEIVRHYREDVQSVEAATKVGSAIIERVEILQASLTSARVIPGMMASTGRCFVTSIGFSTAWTMTPTSFTSRASGMVARTLCR